MKSWNLYVIVDKKTCADKNIEDVTYQSILGGADVIQFRDKTSSTRDVISQSISIKKICSRHNVPFILNDRVDIALSIDSDGVHLGQDDLDIKTARRILGKEKIIGLSTHSIEQAQTAINEPVDYIGVGPIFDTPTKPDYKSTGLDFLKWAEKNVKLPFVVIGGIDLTNIRNILSCKVRTVAVVRAVCQADDVRNAAFLLKKEIVNFRHYEKGQ